jgi:RHS repeat-associated protein
MPNSGVSNTHVFFSFGDHLGSSTVVVDKDTTDVVEYVTYQAYGATESDYRPPQWQGFREDLRFTGKEDDIEVGLTYFGARYYSPYLARFVSPDPLTIHAMGSDLNPYAYVGGRVFNQTDPLGLQGTESDGGGGWDPRDDAPTHASQDGPGSDSPRQGSGGGRGGSPPSGPVIVLPPPPPASSRFLGAAALAAVARLPILGISRARQVDGLYSGGDSVGEDPEFEPENFPQDASERAVVFRPWVSLGPWHDRILARNARQALLAPLASIALVPLTSGGSLLAEGAVAAPSLAVDVDQLAINARNVPTQSEGFFNFVTHGDANSAWVLQDGEWAAMSHRTVARAITGMRHTLAAPFA